MSRRNCPLCDLARAYLGRSDRAARVGISELDIDEDPELQRQFTDRVPVIRYRGVVADEGRIDPRRLETALAALLAGTTDVPHDPVTEAKTSKDRG
ncbi:MAG: glutaredoxin family protein [Candidatus Dormibacteria bacterium]